MLFGTAVKHFRLRFKGNGQQLAGYMWWYANTTYILTPSVRYISIKSKILIDGLATCLIDKNPDWKGASRSVMLQTCRTSASIVDMRDLFIIDGRSNTIKNKNEEYITADPNYK